MRVRQRLQTLVLMLALAASANPSSLICGHDGRRIYTSFLSYSFPECPARSGAAPARAPQAILEISPRPWPCGAGAVLAMHLRGGRRMREGAPAAVRHDKKRKQVGMRRAFVCSLSHTNTREHTYAYIRCLSLARSLFLSRTHAHSHKYTHDQCTHERTCIRTRTQTLA